MYQHVIWQKCAKGWRKLVPILKTNFSHPASVLSFCTSVLDLTASLCSICRHLLNFWWCHSVWTSHHWTKCIFKSTISVGYIRILKFLPRQTENLLCELQETLPCYCVFSVLSNRLTNNEAAVKSSVVESSNSNLLSRPVDGLLHLLYLAGNSCSTLSLTSHLNSCYLASF